MEEKEQIIHDYVDAYNNFDIEKMAAKLDQNIKFENISNGITNMQLQGLGSFKKQAQQAKDLFLKRVQTVTSFKHQDDTTEIEIDYFAILGTDLPNGLKKGDELNLTGRSIFKFLDGKIIELTDIS